MYSVAAIEKLVLRPYLSEMTPKLEAPTNLPIDRATCTVERSAVRSHSRSHSGTIDTLSGFLG